jgi:hypothetical protein
MFPWTNKNINAKEKTTGKNKAEQDYISAKKLITSMQLPAGTDSFGFMKRADLDADAKRREGEIPANALDGLTLSEQHEFLNATMIKLNTLNAEIADSLKAAQNASRQASNAVSTPPAGNMEKETPKGPEAPAGAASGS